MENERRAPHPMLVELSGDMKVVKDRQETMYEQLFGNGQPGIIEKHGKRITWLERIAWSAIAIVLFLEFVLKAPHLMEVFAK